MSGKFLSDATSLQYTEVKSPNLFEGGLFYYETEQSPGWLLGNQYQTKHMLG
jgi:hypothetical protein